MLRSLPPLSPRRAPSHSAQIFYSAALEAKLLDMEEDERAKFLEENKARSHRMNSRIPPTGHHILSREATAYQPQAILALNPAIPYPSGV